MPDHCACTPFGVARPSPSVLWTCSLVSSTSPTVPRRCTRRSHSPACPPASPPPSFTLPCPRLAQPRKDAETALPAPCKVFTPIEGGVECVHAHPTSVDDAPMPVLIAPARERSFLVIGHGDRARTRDYRYLCTCPCLRAGGICADGEYGRHALLAGSPGRRGRVRGCREGRRPEAGVGGRDEGMTHWV